MDIHPPQGSVHSVKDFIIHLSIVTIGIVIALSLEGIIEWRHHRALVREARSNLATEIRSNEDRLHRGLALAPNAEQRLQKTIEIIQKIAGGAGKTKSENVDWSFGIIPLSATAWSTAMNTGAVSYMDYSEVQTYTRIYLLQEQFLSIQQRALDPSSTNGFCNQMVNIGREVHEGVEFKVRAAPIPRLTIDAGYSYLNRTIAYDFANNPTVSQVRTSIVVLPPLPRNKFIGTATVRAIHNMTGMLSVRYEGGLTLQDTTFAATSPLSHPYGEAFATADLGAIVPVYRQAMVQIGVKNVLDRNYFYVAGFPEAGRNWFLNMRYQF